MIANDESKITEKIVAQIHDKYPFGEWTLVHKVKSITYTGRTARVHGDEILVDQEAFIKGRMSDLPKMKSRLRSLDDPCTEEERADFKSGVGDLHWVTSQTRVDHAVDTSRLQKRQNKPTHRQIET